MRLIPLSALCLVTLVLLVVGKKEPSPYDPSRRPEYQESLESLLTESCPKGDKKCLIWSLVAADVCSIPARQKSCQSDCEFLLDLIWETVEAPPLKSQLKSYVPDDCVPERRPYSDALRRQEAKKPRRPEEEESCPDENDDDEEEESAFHSYHFGVETNENELEHAFLNSRTVDPKRNITYCRATTPGGSKQVQSGEAWTLPCSDEFGQFFSGDILFVCSYSGTVVKTRSQCNFDDKKALKPFRALAGKGGSGLPSVDPKEAFENGAKLMEGLSEFLSKDSIKDFLPIAGKLASVLGPIGAAFQVLAFFLPESDPKFDAIMNQFKEMTMKFAEISNQISQLEDVFTKLLWEGKMDAPVQNLIYLEKCIEDYSNQKTDPYLKRVEAACKVFPGDKFVTDMLYVMGSKSSHEIAKIYKYDRNSCSNQFAKGMLVYSVRGASAAVHCMGLHKNATEADSNYLAKSQQDLITSLYKITSDLYYDFIPNRAMNNYIINDVDNFMATYHSSSNDKIASALYDHLTKTYDWYYGFGVAIYKNVDSKTGAVETKCNRCVGQKNSGSYHVASDYDKTVYLTYGVKITPDIEQYVIDVYNYAGRESVQPVADYFVNKGTKYPVRNAMVVKFGNGLRASLSSAARFNNVQSTSIMVSY